MYMGWSVSIPSQSASFNGSPLDGFYQYQPVCLGRYVSRLRDTVAGERTDEQGSRFLERVSHRMPRSLTSSRGEDHGPQ
jgi:hypothetical protein